MKKQSVFTRILIIVGSILVWVLALLQIVFSFRPLPGGGKFHLDYLLPAVSDSLQVSVFCFNCKYLCKFRISKHYHSREYIIPSFYW